MNKRVMAFVMMAVVMFGLVTCKKETIVLPTVKVFEGSITLDHTKAGVSAEVIDQGGTEVKSRGFVYGQLDSASDTVFCGSGTGVFSAELTGLEPNTAYVYEAFAKNAGGFGTSGKVTFTTLDISMPTVKTGEVTEVTTTTALCGGEVTNDGGATVSERGVCLSTEHNPGINNEHFASGQGLGVFCIETTGLLSNTTYYVRAYAINAKGVSYGEEKVFDTYSEPEQNYIISVEASPSEGGTVSGGGTYQEEQSCTVEAVAKPGYTFTNWTEEGNEVSTSVSYSFVVTGDRYLEAHFTANLQNYTISVSANPPIGGVATGGGNYQQGHSCSVHATANSGYTFVNWTEDGYVVSSSPSYMFVVNGNRTLAANFEQTYTITVSSNPSNGGMTTGGGTYIQGEICALIATAADGYTFVNWTENGSVVSTNPNYTFTVNCHRTLVANYTEQLPNTYNINVSADPRIGGTVTGGGSYQQGQSCIVSATANMGYTFLRWTENGQQVSTNSSYSFAVTGNRTLVAQFQAQGYTISVSANPSSGGTVSGGGNYNYGQNCTVTASVATGYTFLRWIENGQQVSTNSSYTFTVTGNRTLVAQFQAQGYTISVSSNPNSGGTVIGGGTYNYGQSCTVIATAANGYTFTNWTENGTVVSTNASYTFNVSGNRTLVANFTQRHTVAVSASPSNGGSVTGGGTYNHGQSCTVIATVANGYTFTNWTEGGNVVSTNANYTFTVNNNRTLVANFSVQAPNTYTINASPNPSVGGTVTGGGTYNYGQSCTVIATAANGYTFTNWTENGTVVSTNASYTFNVSGNRTLVANFTQRYTVAVSASPSNGGSVTGGGTYNHGQSCTVIATVANGYTFTNWTEGGNVVSTNANYTFTVNNNRTLVANFSVQAPNTYTINASPNPSVGGTVTGGGTYQQGQSCTVAATAATGYAFTNWTENGTVVSTNANYTFTVSSNRTLVAQFQLQSYTISASVTPSNSGMVTGAGSYNHGQNCTLTATASTGYVFVNWTKNGTQVSTNATYTFAVTASASYVAHFQAQSYTIGVSANPSNGGSVTGSGNYNYGQSCTVSATAATGYTFTNWTESGSQVSTNANYTFTVSGNRTLVANFTLQTTLPTVTTSQVTSITQTMATGGGNVTNSGNATVTERGICWSTSHNPTISGSHASNGTGTGSFTVNMTGLTTNTTYYVRAYATNSVGTAYGGEESFTTSQIPTYTIGVSANPTAGGTVTGGGTYQQGQSCTVSATAATGYTFLRWTENGNEVSTNASYQFTVSGNRTLVAQFYVTNYTISVSSNPTNGGSPYVGSTPGNTSGTYTNGQSCTVHANPATGYTFTNWTEGGSQVSTNANYTFTVNGNRTLVANFTYNSIGGHEFVDLGLPSGLLWATCNVGADNPEDYGDYFAWGETQTKDVYDWNTYQYCNGSGTTLTKYCSTSSYGYNGFTDNLTTLQSSDDAATANWSSGWRIPTQTEWNEMLNNTTHTETTRNGVYGWLFTSSNGNSLFLPDAGERDGSSLDGVGSYGGYWSSSLDTDFPRDAWLLSNGVFSVMGTNFRRVGHSVRAVHAASRN